MKLKRPETQAPDDAEARRSVEPVVCYPVETLPKPETSHIKKARTELTRISQILVAPRTAETFDVKAGQFFRIVSVEGPQVGDLNLFQADDLTERFYTGKTRALHGTHLSTGDRMWSTFPHLRPMATISHDTLDWYGFDDFGGSVHDVIGTRCDPYTHRLLSGNDYHYCCHSNLTRAMMDTTGMSFSDAEMIVHDVLNVFMCTGFSRQTGQYFMKASPVRPGDFIEFFAETDLLGALSACPGGDCSSEHSSDVSACHPLLVEVYESTAEDLEPWVSSQPSPYRS